ncbi:FecR domain-containing protein [Flavobacterium sp. MFBS3-15]|uniref:FecR family protein n=1 Tax=Flavobacterium sp. MFBS3-15 TaxID=2989816 RepID=UPI002235A0A8|nr:FecR domain-containing protein [Flavobacterium sp. MFBS3-15]MCW4469689.1 FecR domain-containing protein [Flavobacterium sp. MFBS3-15]
MKDDTLLARWLEGELTPQEQAALEQDPRYASFLRIKSTFGEIERPGFEGTAILEGILAKEKSPKVIPLYRRGWFQTVAASVVLLMGLALLFTRPETKEAAYGQTLAFTLPDASEVVLNAGSEAGYSDWNWENNRTIELEGEAYFKVARGKKFTVKTVHGDVTVLGTQFNVRVRENRLDVVCYEGKVQVEHNGSKTVLAPHESYRLDTDELLEGTGMVPATKPGWIYGELEFNYETLDYVLDELERTYNIEIETTVKREQTFSVTLPANNIDKAMDIIGRLYKLEAHKHDKKIILKPVDSEK